MRVLGTLALTHSSRSTNLARCSVQFLTRRFGHPDRLAQKPPFASLEPAERLYSGAASFYRVEMGSGGRFRLRRLGAVKRRDKIQHVGFAETRELLVGYEHFVERWRLREPIEQLARIGDPAPERRFEHPHLAGLHTVEPLGPTAAALSCSAADAVLLLDPETGEVRRELRLPEELYGEGYRLTPEMDLRRHYVDDGWQAAHVNAAFASPDGRWLAVSTLIQGAIGLFDLESGAYRELTRGFVGCHGARFDDRGRIYFADSATGTLVVLDGGRIARRFAVGSPWLHDVQQIDGGVFAFALSQPNELRLYDVDRDLLLCRRRFLRWPPNACFRLARRLPWWLGNSAQALSFLPAAGPGRAARAPG